MKKIWTFIGGIVTGMVLLSLISYLVAQYNTSNGMTFFEKEGECIDKSSFTIFQVFESGDALAQTRFGDIVVLFLNEEGKPYYDGQDIDIPDGKCAKQIGIFRYEANSGMEKTVPIVRISNK